MIDLFPLIVPSRNVIGLSIALHRRHSLSHWDRMLLAACIEAGVDTFDSENLSPGEFYESVMVVNSFA
ncbi:MAG: hypothetical protein R3C59_01365 [Planctomycetaceae bacterium]